MITNNIDGKDFNTLLYVCTQSETQAEFDKAKRHLLIYINAWALGSKVRAVEEFKATCRHQGLIAIVESELTEILDAAQFPNGFEMPQLRTTALNSGISVPEDLTPDFTIEDHDLNTLLNDTAFMVRGTGNMDTGLAWLAALERVQERLAIADAADMEAPSKEDKAYKQIRNRVHTTINATFGREALKSFKFGALLKHIFDDPQIATLLQALEKEFKGSFPADVRQRLVSGGNKTLIDQLYIVLDVTENAEPFSEVADAAATIGRMLDRADTERKVSEDAELMHTLERLGIENQLAEIAVRPDNFTEREWRKYQGNDIHFLRLLNPSAEDEYDDPAGFFQDICDHFGLNVDQRTALFSASTLSMKYVDFVTQLHSMVNA